MPKIGQFGKDGTRESTKVSRTGTHARTCTSNGTLRLGLITRLAVHTKGSGSFSLSKPMEKFFENVLKIRNEVGVSLGDLEDFGDRFNHIGSVVVFIICAFVVTTKQYFLKPIACYIATDVGGSNLLSYVENYCWVQGTIPVRYAGKMPQTDADWDRLEEKKIRKFSSTRTVKNNLPNVSF